MTLISFILLPWYSSIKLLGEIQFVCISKQESCTLCFIVGRKIELGVNFGKQIYPENQEKKIAAVYLIFRFLLYLAEINKGKRGIACHLNDGVHLTISYQISISRIRQDVFMNCILFMM